MLDICLLGTGGMMPLPRRWLTSLMLRYNGKSILIDCGEGTQLAIKEQGWSFNPIDVICFTHYHADHISGLPGLLLTMGNADRTEPVTMIGPKGLSRVVSSLRVIAPELPFEINFIELTENEQTIEICGLVIEAFKVNHNVLCYGYSVKLNRQGRFMVEKAEENNIPKQYWSKLQKGEDIEYEGRILTPDMVLGEERKGLHLVYCTDTRPMPIIASKGIGSDLMILEGMYGEPDKIKKAKEYKHMTFYEAAELAKEADTKQMWLTHYSPSLIRPEEYLEEVRKIFPRTIVAKDGRSVVLNFEED
ncbi:MAG: ribonuclease Z [Lachnospiraceae bacterium]|jgi:ribonuclease Z|nr:ribonuclease Z [Lachnospiraceae bacterium]